MPSFPILSLPILILQEVLRCLNPIELFEFSQCSLKAAKKVRLVGARKLRLWIVLSYKYVAINGKCFNVIENNGGCQYESLLNSGTRKIGRSTVKVLSLPFKNSITFYWNAPNDGLETLFVHLSKLFGVPTNSVRSYPHVSRLKFNSAMECVVDHQKTVKCLWLEGKDILDEDVTFVLKNLWVRENFEISVKLSANFKVDQTILLDCQQYKISHSSWVTLDNVLSMKWTKMIFLWESSLTTQDIHKLFKKWRLGKLSALEYLYIESKNFDENMKIDGLNELEGTENGISTSKMIFGRERKIHNAVPILRDDGVTGLIQFDLLEKKLTFLVL